MPGLGSHGAVITPTASDIVGPKPNIVGGSEAVTAMTDAFRSGYITADDIMKRTDELGQTKRKADIAVNQLQERQAKDQLGNQALAMATAKSKMEHDKAITDLGPGGETIQAMFAGAGMTVPMVESTLVPGTKAVDMAKVNELTPKMFKWMSEEKRKADEYKGWKPIEVPNMKTNMMEQKFWNEFKGPTSLRNDMPSPNRKTFFDWNAESQIAPGTVASAGIVQGPIAPILINKQSVAAGVPTVGTPAVPPQAGLAVKPLTTRENPKIPSEGVKDLNMTRQAAAIVASAAEKYADLIKSEPGLVGYIDGLIPNWTGGKLWNEKVAAFEAESTKMLAPLAKGTYGETGVLSDQDIKRYQAVVPNIRQNPKVGVQQMNTLLLEVNGNLSKKLDGWRRSGYDVVGWEDLDKAIPSKLLSAPGAAAQSAGGGGDTVTLPSGKIVDRQGRVVGGNTAAPLVAPRVAPVAAPLVTPRAAPLTTYPVEPAYSPVLKDPLTAGRFAP